jgi:hypothetical protein
VWESRRRFQFCVERFQSIRRLFLSLRNFVILAARQPEPHNGQPRGCVPYLVGSRLPRPYRFAARIQSFQAIAAPFPGASFFISLSRRDPGDRNASVQKLDNRLGGLL